MLVPKNLVKDPISRAYDDDQTENNNNCLKSSASCIHSSGNKKAHE